MFELDVQLEVSRLPKLVDANHYIPRIIVYEKDGFILLVTQATWKKSEYAGQRSCILLGPVT